LDGAAGESWVRPEEKQEDPVPQAVKGIALGSDQTTVAAGLIGVNEQVTVLLCNITDAEHDIVEEAEGT
jgi:hypothetical protein